MSCEVLKAINGCKFGYCLESNSPQYCIVLGNLVCQEYGKENPKTCKLFQTAEKLGVRKEHFRFSPEMREFRFIIPNRQEEPELWKQQWELLKKLETAMMNHVIAKMNTPEEYGW